MHHLATRLQREKVQKLLLIMRPCHLQEAFSLLHFKKLFSPHCARHYKTNLLGFLEQWLGTPSDLVFGVVMMSGSKEPLLFS